MRVIDLNQSPATLEQVIGLAKDEPVLIRKADGSTYALASVDDFDVEVELLKHNADFMALMRKFSNEKPAISLEELRKELAT